MNEDDSLATRPCGPEWIKPNSAAEASLVLWKASSTKFITCLRIVPSGPKFADARPISHRHQPSEQKAKPLD